MDRKPDLNLSYVSCKLSLRQLVWLLLYLLIGAGCLDEDVWGDVEKIWHGADDELIDALADGLAEFAKLYQSCPDSNDAELLHQLSQIGELLNAITLEAPTVDMAAVRDGTRHFWAYE